MAVNFATETAAVEYLPGAVTQAALRAAVEGAGYALREPEAGSVVSAGDQAAEARRRELLVVRRKTIVSLGVGAFLMLLGFFPPSFLSQGQLRHSRCRRWNGLNCPTAFRLCWLNAMPFP